MVVGKNNKTDIHEARGCGGMPLRGYKSWDNEMHVVSHPTPKALD